MLSLADKLPHVSSKPSWLSADGELGASMLGRCPRKQCLVYLGFKEARTAAAAGLMASGSSVHAVIQEFAVILDPHAQVEVRYLRSIGGVVIRATLDIVLDDCAYEMKTYGFKDQYTAGLLEKPTPPWRKQVEMQRLLSEREMYLLTTPRSYPLSKVTLTHIPASEDVLAEVLSEVGAVSEAMRSRRLPPMQRDAACLKCGMKVVCLWSDDWLDPFDTVRQQLVAHGHEDKVRGEADASGSDSDHDEDVA